MADAVTLLYHVLAIMRTVRDGIVPRSLAPTVEMLVRTKPSCGTDVSGSSEPPKKGQRHTQTRRRAHLMWLVCLQREPNRGGVRENKTGRKQKYKCQTGTEPRGQKNGQRGGWNLAARMGIVN